MDRRLCVLATLGLLAILNASAGGATAGITSVPLTDQGGAGDGPRFERLSPELTGITFANRFDPLNEKIRNDILESPFVYGGVAVGDYDGDGLPDVYLTSAFSHNRLYRNLGNAQFEDVTERAGVEGAPAWNSGASFADVDNDGDLDLYICLYDNPNRLYINQGDGTFTESAESFGMDFKGASVMSSFCDYDRDGDLDAFVLTNRLWHLPPPKNIEVLESSGDGDATIKPEYRGLVSFYLEEPSLRFAGEEDRLLRNNGDGSFTDATQESGISGYEMGLAATWWDYNQDGSPDLYVSNDFWEPDRLYHNNGDGTFRDVTTSLLPHTPWLSMGADLGDLNNDGRIDFIATDMAATTHYKQKMAMGEMGQAGTFLRTAVPRQYMRNAVYLNTGTERYMEAAYLTGLASTDWTWSVNCEDMDNDGRVDVYFTNGIMRDWTNPDHVARINKLIPPEDLPRIAREGYIEKIRYWLATPPRVEANLAYRNLGDLKFQEVGPEWGLNHMGISNGAVFADLDRDGDLDLVVNNFDEEAGVYRNQTTDTHGVLIRLEGTESNRFGIGARVEMKTRTGGVQARQLTLTRGYMSNPEPLIHFGLGVDPMIEQLTVLWPSGQRQTFADLESDRFYTITEPQREPPVDKAVQSRDDDDGAEKMFGRSDGLRGIRHHERPFDDYERQPLLPYQLSKLGPGLAFGDADGDGDDDLYLGGAAGQRGMLHINDGEGNFGPGPARPFQVDRECEDMSPLWFDADGDGDLDLYVASGGVEAEPGDEVLRDRLYLNGGGAQGGTEGQFTKAPRGALPDLRDSSGTVAAGDFDRDGDLDLFVGGRSIPGKYPLAPKSRLLRNDPSSSTFTDITAQVAPDLLETGMVTSALWSDVDDDGWIDLWVTHEWGPIKLYRNHQGSLQDETRDAGLAERLGWWNAIAGRDLDGDGDIDYAVTNFGLNTKYHPSPRKPAQIYYGDFEGTGKRCIVEAEFEGESLFPIRGRSCSSNAMPFLWEGFPTFDLFAKSTLQEIYTPQCLQDAYTLRATHLESGVLINDGQGHFEFEPLPHLAQVSPGFGVILTEVDGDGRTDLYMVHNFLNNQPETGRMDGGVSLLLLGGEAVGDAGLTPVWPLQSGLVVPGDAKSLAQCDLNNDGWPDFIIGVNDGELMAFENRGSQTNRAVKVRLRGGQYNPTGIGALVALKTSAGTLQTAELAAGGSYLSQSSKDLFFGLGPGDRVEEIRVRWPDGRSVQYTEDLDRQVILLEK